MVIKNLENKIKLVLIICSLFLAGCIIICISSIWTARTMVSDAHKKSMFWTAMCLFLFIGAQWTKRLT